MNGFSSRRSLWGIHDATMKMSGGMETEEIAILCENHPPFSTGLLQMRSIGCAEEARLSHCFDINASFA